MIRLLWLILFAVHARPGVSEEDQQPVFEFKGVPLGAAEEQFRKVHSDFLCRDVEANMKALGDRVCSAGATAPFTYGGVPVRIVAVYFYADRLSSVNVSIDEKHFRTLSQALNE